MPAPTPSSPGGREVEVSDIPGLAATFAITTDFDAAVLQDKGDLERVPGKLRASGVDADARLASQAEQGMRMIVREPVRLRGPDRAMLERTREESGLSTDVPSRGTRPTWAWVNSSPPRAYASMCGAGSTSGT